MKSLIGLPFLICIIDPFLLPEAFLRFDLFDFRWWPFDVLGRPLVTLECVSANCCIS